MLPALKVSPMVLALLLLPGGASRQPDAASLKVVGQDPKPVLTVRDDNVKGNKYGFEGGRVVKIQQTYYLFTSEMAGDPHWVKMRLAVWTSQDRIHWKRKSTLFESSGDFTGKDPRAALWSPMPVFDRGTNRWNLFYVAYQASPDTAREWLTNHEGRIWRAVSTQSGLGGIDGPYHDSGIILQRGKNADSWEGLQGTDSFFPYRVGDKWYAFYGSAHTEKLPISLWQVGLARAPSLAGPWTRCTSLNPVRVEPRFIENPVVTRLRDGRYVAVYDNHQSNEVGYTFSHDGIHWSSGRHLIVQTGNGIWASEVRTPLGLVPEENGRFTLFYTANERANGSATDAYGVTLTPGALGFVEVQLIEENGTSVRTEQHVAPD